MSDVNPEKITEENFNGCHWNSLMSYHDNPTAAIATIGDALGNIGRLLVQIRDEARVRTDDSYGDCESCAGTGGEDEYHRVCADCNGLGWKKK